MGDSLSEGGGSWVYVPDEEDGAKEAASEDTNSAEFILVTRTLQNASGLEHWLEKESLSRTFRSSTATTPDATEPCVSDSDMPQIMMAVSREAFMEDLLSGFEKSNVQPRVKPFQALLKIGASILHNFPGQRRDQPPSMNEVTWGKVLKQFCLDVPRMIMVVDGVGCSGDPEEVMGQLAALFSSLALSPESLQNAVRLCALFSQQSVMALPLTALSLHFAKRGDDLHVGEPDFGATTSGNRLQVFVERFGAKSVQLNISKVLRVFSSETSETVHMMRVVLTIDVLDNVVPVSLQCVYM